MDGGIGLGWVMEVSRFGKLDVAFGCLSGLGTSLYLRRRQGKARRPSLAGLARGMEAFRTLRYPR